MMRLIKLEVSSKIFINNHMTIFGKKTHIISQFLTGFFMLLIMASVMVTAGSSVTSSAHAQAPGKPLVQCEGFLLPAEQGTDKKTCNFAELINTVKYLINWMIIVATPIVTVLFAYAGFLFMSAKEKNISHAREIFAKVGIGYFFMLAAWLIVKFILDALVKNQSYLFFFK